MKVSINLLSEPWFKCGFHGCYYMWLGSSDLKIHNTPPGSLHLVTWVGPVDFKASLRLPWVDWAGEVTLAYTPNQILPHSGLEDFRTLDNGFYIFLILTGWKTEKKAPILSKLKEKLHVNRKCPNVRSYKGITWYCNGTVTSHPKDTP